ncbi:MAG TPA: hypothetical protein VIE64_06690 [Solirubrobacterales bacterium]|jgi:hypothetical protein
MKRLKGPELKLSELKVPPFLTDLYWDLRDRRLLPLVALVAVAIVAVPFLLGGGSDKSPAPAPPPVAVISGAAGTDAPHLTVVQAKPGLRDYRKRLASRQPTDPFEQRFTAPQVKGAELGGELESTTSSTTSTSTTETTKTSDDTKTTTVTTETTDESKGGGASPDSQLTLFAFAIDVKITRIDGGGDGSKPKSDSSTRHRVMPTTPLPGEKAPVVTYMGVGKGAKKALLMVSNNVKSIFGDAQCLSGTDTCQLLEVEPGFPETFFYGDNGVRYKINVLKITAVPTGHT